MICWLIFIIDIFFNFDFWIFVLFWPRRPKFEKASIKKLKLKNVELTNDDFICSNFQEEEFDAIVISSALTYIDEDLKKLLKVGGSLFVVVGSKNHMHATIVSRSSKIDWQTKSLFETRLEFMKGHEPVEQFSF